MALAKGRLAFHCSPWASSCIADCDTVHADSIRWCDGLLWVWLNRTLKNSDGWSAELHCLIWRFDWMWSENDIGGSQLVSDTLLRSSCKAQESPKIATWLILPEVIRSSQRLSHACLSIKTFYTWNCEWLIISVIVYLIIPYYLDNCSNSRANTWINTQLSGRVVFIR